MGKEQFKQFNTKFDIAFHNALRQSIDLIEMPEDHIILESWHIFQSKLESHREISYANEK